MDPEARPSLAETLYAIKAIAMGSPLPPYELSDQAKEKKEERRQAQLRRANQTQKKSAALPTRDHVPLAANSVAARRLAAKRGGTAATSEGSFSAPIASASSSSSFLFDDSAPIPAAASSSAPLDLFGPSHPAPAAQVASSSLFDDFSAPTPVPAKTSSAPAPAVDLFATDFFSSPAQNQATSTPVSVPPSVPASKTAAPVDFFGGSNSLLSDMSFATAPPPTQAEKARNVLDLFDQPSPALAQPGRGAPSDPFASVMGGLAPGGGYPQPAYGYPPSSGMGYGAPPPRGSPFGPPAVRAMPPQQQQQRPQERDPFGSLGGFDAMKKK
jgi:hypothetical protein